MSCQGSYVSSGITNSPSERHAELVSASPRIPGIIGEILKQVQDDVPIMVQDDLE